MEWIPATVGELQLEQNDAFKIKRTGNVYNIPQRKTYACLHECILWTNI